jgi:hypothetical protein
MASTTVYWAGNPVPEGVKVRVQKIVGKWGLEASSTSMY